MVVSDKTFQLMIHLHGGASPKFTTTDSVYTGGGWAHLPKPFLYSLLKYLNFRTDAPRLRAVCSTWRSSLPAKYIPQQLMAFDGAPKLPFSNLPIIVFSNKFLLVSSLLPDNSNSPWIINVLDLSTPGSTKFTLHNPVLSVRKYFESDPPIVGQVNLLDCNVIELASTFSLFGGVTRAGVNLKSLSEKVVGGWDFSSEYFFAILAKVRDTINGCSTLVYLRIGQMRWTHIKDMKPVSGDKTENSVLKSFDVADIVLYEGEFYALDYTTWQIAIIDPSAHALDESPTVELIDGPKVVFLVISGVKFVNVDGVLYAIKGVNFVPSKDGLYLLLVVSGCEGLKLKENVIVFELDEDEFEWVRVSSIGEQNFFIGSDVAFSVSAKALPRWKSGSVCLFNMQSMAMFEGNVEASGAEMFEGLEGIESVSYPKYWKWFRLFNVEEEEEWKGIVPFAELDREVYTGVFFPPPSWVRWSCPQLGDVPVEFWNLRLSDGGGDNPVDCDAASEGKCLILEEIE